MKVAYRIPDPFLGETTSGQERLQQLRTQILALRGQAAIVEAEVVALQGTLRVVCGLVCSSAKLPEAPTPYQLSEDGTQLLNEWEDTKDETPPVAPDAAA
jgi:hypothetical protein